MTTTTTTVTAATNTVADLSGQRVRCVAAYPEYAASTREVLAGKTGTVTSTKPDGQGDIMVQFDDTYQGSTNWYVREWTMLDDNDQPVEAPVVAVATPDDDPTVTERRLADLIDSIYETAASRGYGSLLPALMDSVGIPLRPSDRKVTITVTRVLGIERVDATARFAMREALAASVNGDLAGDAEIMHIDPMERVQIVVPYPTDEPVEGECKCYTLATEVTAARGRNLPVAVLEKIGGALGHRRFDSYTVGAVLGQPGTGFAIRCRYCS